jgi:hypothetical protein
VEPALEGEVLELRLVVEVEQSVIEVEVEQVAFGGW